MKKGNERMTFFFRKERKVEENFLKRNEEEKW